MTDDHPLDDFLAARSNTIAHSCVVCHAECAAIVVVSIEKADAKGKRIFGPKSSRSKRFAMCSEHAISMFDQTTAEGLT